MLQVVSMAGHSSEYLCHEVGCHAGLRWYKLLLHDSTTVLKPRRHGTASNHVLYERVPLLQTSRALTAWTYTVNGEHQLTTASKTIRAISNIPDKARPHRSHRSSSMSFNVP